MKKLFITSLLIASATIGLSAQAQMSATGPGGSCSACKVEMKQNPVAQEALNLLVQGGGAKSSELQVEIERLRNELDKKFGFNSSFEISDEELLLIISAK